MPYKDINKRKEYAKLRYKQKKEEISKEAKEYYQANKESKKAKSAEYRKANKDKIKAYYKKTKDKQVRQVVARRDDRKDSYIKLKGSRCEICGFEYNGENAACFDFHHLDPNEKDYEPSTAIRLSREKAIAELSKCQLVCANCHRLIHYRANI